MRFRSLIFSFCLALSLFCLSTFLTGCLGSGEDCQFGIETGCIGGFGDVIPGKGDGKSGGGDGDGNGKGSGNESGVCTEECAEDKVCDPTTKECEFKCEADLDCGVNKQCDKVSGLCEDIPKCSSNDDCLDTEICSKTSKFCEEKPDGFCASNDECSSSQKCDNNICVASTCADQGIVCSEGQFLNSENCECIDASEGSCILKFHARIKIYIDTTNPGFDLPNFCDSEGEEDDFECEVPSTPEDLDIFESTAPLLPLFPELAEFQKGECYRLTGQSRTQCLARDNVPIVAMAPIGDKPIELELQRTPGSNTGPVFVKAKDFPQYQIYNCSPDLTGDLILDAGAGVALDSGSGDAGVKAGGSDALAEYVGIGTFTETSDGVHFNIPMYFRAMAHNPIINGGLDRNCTAHDAPAPTWFVPSGPNAGGPALSCDGDDPGGDAPDNFHCATTFVPNINEDVDPIFLTTGITEASGDPTVAAPDTINNIRLVGEPLRIVDGRARMKMVIGITIPADDKLLAGLEGAALAAEIVPKSECPYAYKSNPNYCPGINKDNPAANPPDVTDVNGVAFTTLDAACGAVAATCPDGSAPPCDGGSSPVTINVNYTDAKGGSFSPTVSGNDTAGFSIDVNYQGTPFFAELPTDVGGHFSHTGSTLTITNTSSGSAIPLLINSSSAFDTSADLSGLAIAPGATVNLPLVFTPSASTTGCALDGGGLTMTCTGSILVSNDPVITVSLTGTAQAPKAALQITEMDLLNAEEGTNIFPDTSFIFPELADAGPVDFGEVLAGKWRIKLYRIANNGVRDLTVSNIAVSKLGSTPNNVFLRGNFVYQGENNTNWVVKSNAGTYQPVTPDGQKDLFVYVIYMPYYVIFGSDAEPVQDNGILSVQTSVGNKNFALTGLANSDTTALMEVYVEDQDTLLPECRQDTTSGLPLDKERCYREFDGSKMVLVYGLKAGEIPENPQFSFRMDGRVKKVAIRSGKTEGDTLRIKGLSVVGAGDNFDYTEIIPLDPADDAIFHELTPGEMVQVGTIQYNLAPGDLNSSGTYTVVSANLNVTADSIKVATGGVQESLALNASLKGVKHAPHGVYDLIIYRLISGINDNLISMKIVSSVTEYQVSQSGVPGAESEKYTVEADFDAEKGIVKLSPVFTPYKQLGLSGNSLSDGLRFFNPLGSKNSNSYPFWWDCLASSPLGESGCVYFHGYLGNRSFLNNALPGVSSLPAIFGGYTTVNTDPAMVSLDPANAADAAKMQTIMANEEAKAQGLYDPVTGEITFARNIAVRLYTKNPPGVDSLPGSAVDSVLATSLTTECMTDDLFVGSDVSPEQRKTTYLKSNGKLRQIFPFAKPPFGATDAEFGPNPTTPYMAGALNAKKIANPAEAASVPDEMPHNCEDGLLHGRRMYMPGMPADNEDVSGTSGFISGGNPANPNFDIGGVAEIKANASNVEPETVMYLVIKACLVGRTTAQGYPASGCNP